MTYTIKITNKNTVSGVTNVNTLYLDTISPSLITDLKSTYEAFIKDMEVTDTSIYVPLYKRFQVAKVPASSVLVITTDNSSEAIYYRSLKLNNSFILIDPDPITSAYVDPVLIEKTITENGIYLASQDDADGYSLVDVNVPNTYTQLDEGKVVSSGVLIAQTSGSTTQNGTVDTTTISSLEVTVEPDLTTKSISENGTYNASSDSADGYSSVTVNVPNTYKAGDEGKVVQSGALVAQTATSTTTNGTIDTTTNNSIVVNVANSYVAADEGKVVSNGALVAQTAYPTEITENDTYDTTNYNSITVNVSGGSSSVVAICTFDFSENQFFMEDESGIIAEGAFYECFSLTSITIPSSVTSIDSNAFAECSSLTSITFESDSSLESIGYAAFYNCSALTSITIPSSLESIGDYAFYQCSALETVTFEADSSLESIGSVAFYECQSLTSITIPNSVTSIISGAFEDCRALTSVTFEADSSLESIGGGAFHHCQSLTSITIPSSVTSIDSNAFAECSSLETVTFESTIPPVLDGDLGIETTCTIRVPQGTLSDYTSASNYPDPNSYTYVEY